MGITGFAYSTGDVLSAADMNALVQFDVSTKTADYTGVLADSYQSLIVMNKATAIAFKIPTDARHNNFGKCRGYQCFAYFSPI